jgi:uncharacterized circularly permuted ATP-grasp superfamily protein
LPTYLPVRRDYMRYVRDHRDELVVKSVNESGGYGMLIGPHASRAEIAECRARIIKDPRNHVAQPTLALSRHPCWVDDHLEGRQLHRDACCSGARCASPGVHARRVARDHSS